MSGCLAKKIFTATGSPKTFLFILLYFYLFILLNCTMYLFSCITKVSFQFLKYKKTPEKIQLSFFNLTIHEWPQVVEDEMKESTVLFLISNLLPEEKQNGNI